MALGSSEDFLGGYDHAAEAGLVHVANHHIAPGKKQWTWGNHDFGYGWDRHLTDDDGPYIELMAGVYTDNQPDFSFLAAGETKSFSQYWYPIRKIGPAQKANVDSAVSLQFRDGRARVGVCVSGRFPKRRLKSRRAGKSWRDGSGTSRRTRRWSKRFAAENTVLTVSVRAADGRELIRYTPQAVERHAAPQPAVAPALPAEIPSNDELYLTGLHLEQYRHVTRRPEDYWREALRRDPGDSRCNNAMGLWHLRRGEFTDAERHFRAAIATLTRRNPNPLRRRTVLQPGTRLAVPGPRRRRVCGLLQGHLEPRLAGRGLSCARRTGRHPGRLASRGGAPGAGLAREQRVATIAQPAGNGVAEAWLRRRSRSRSARYPAARSAGLLGPLPGTEARSAATIRSAWISPWTSRAPASLPKPSMF